MKALIVFATILIFSLHSSNGRPDKNISLQQPRTPSQIVMDSVALTDRPNFVAFHISIAIDERRRDDVVFKPLLETIPKEKREEFARIQTPPNFSTNLLDWTELELVPFKNGQKHNLERLGVDGEVRNVCFPNGCVDPNDAGELCCPF